MNIVYFVLNYCTYSRVLDCSIFLCFLNLFFSFYIFLISTPVGLFLLYPMFPRDLLSSILASWYSPLAISTDANHERMYVPFFDHNLIIELLSKYLSDILIPVIPFKYCALTAVFNLISSTSIKPCSFLLCSKMLRFFSQRV